MNHESQSLAHPFLTVQLDEKRSELKAVLDLSVIIVNWNSLDYLRECVASIYQHTHGISFEIIVVDNASPEGGIEEIQPEYPEVSIVRSRENIGFARANNLGFRQASGNHMLLLNPDTKLIGPAITLMLDAIKSLPDAGVVGCKMLNTDLSVQTTSIQKFPTITNQLLNIEYLRVRWPGCPLWNIAPLFSSSSAPVKVDVIPGACMLLRRDVFENIGMLSEDYFMYAEDLDLNYKVKSQGLSNYYIGEAQIIHHGGRSSSRQKVSQWATIMKYKAMLQFYVKSRGRFYSSMYRAAMGLAAAGRLVLLALAFPFADREVIQAASAKWGAVFKWAFGLNHGTFIDTNR